MRQQERPIDDKDRGRDYSLGEEGNLWMPARKTAAPGKDWVRQNLHPRDPQTEPMGISRWPMGFQAFAPFETPGQQKIKGRCQVPEKV